MDSGATHSHTYTYTGTLISLPFPFPLSFLLPPSLPPYSLIFSFFINYLILIKIFLFISASKLEGDIPFTWLALFEF